jgi:protein disulfide-isomerase A1
MISLLYILSILTAKPKISALEVENNVIVLHDSNFDEEVLNQKHMLVEFYAPWCGHCKKLAPIYASAAKILAEGDNPVLLAKVDATANKELKERFKVTGYPDLFWVKNG